MAWPVAANANREVDASKGYENNGHAISLPLLQVMPQLRRRRAAEGGHAAFRQQFWWQVEFHRLLRSHQSPEAKQAHKQTVARLRQARLKSLHMLLALDHTLQFVCSGLQQYMTKPRDVPAPLGVNMRRYKVPWVGPQDPGCPAELQALARKFVVEDTLSKERWYELQMFPAGCDHPCLAVLTDEGPDNMAASAFAMSALQMRVVWQFDCLHRVINDMQLALKASGLWALIQELLHVLNINHAPWVSRAFFKELQEAFNTFMDTATPDHDVFQALLERLARDKGMASQDTMDQAKCKELLELAACSRCWDATGKQCKWRMWCSVFERLHEFLPDWNSTLLAIAIMGRELGAWQDSSQMPIWETASSDIPVIEEMDEGATWAVAKQNLVGSGFH